MTSPASSDYTYESESEFDLSLRDARRRVRRDGVITNEGDLHQRGGPATSV